MENRHATRREMLKGSAALRCAVWPAPASPRGGRIDPGGASDLSTAGRSVARSRCRKVRSRGILLIQNWWGFNDGFGRWMWTFARLDYVVVTIFYGEVGRPASPRSVAGGRRRSRAGPWWPGDCCASTSLGRCAIGWCFGGGWSLSVFAPSCHVSTARQSRADVASLQARVALRPRIRIIARWSARSRCASGKTVTSHCTRQARFANRHRPLRRGERDGALERTCVPGSA